MIQPIIESLLNGVEYLGFLQKLYPLVEQKESEGKTSIEYYKGKGQYETAFNIDNYNGVGYFRKIEDVEVSKIDNEFKACSNLMSVKYVIRFVASINRDELPSDCAFSDDELAWEIASQLTGKNGELKSALKADTVYVQATRLSTDRKQILASELPGDNIVDLNYNLSLIAIDFTVDLTIQQKCIDSICASYHYTLNQ